MSRIYFSVILLILLALEGVALDFLPVAIIESDSVIISHWVFIFIFYIALYYDTENTYNGVILAIIFGLLIDIVYTDVLGVYMFAYFVAIYIIFIMGRSLQINLLGAIILGIVGIVIVDFIIYFIYYFIGVTYMTINHYAYYRLLPTVLANVIFVIILYPLLSKRLKRWQERALKL